MAGLTPAAVISELVNDDGTMKRGLELRAFADEHGLAMISIEDLVRYRRRNEVLVKRVAETRLPTGHGEFTAYGYTITVDGSEHVALVYGELGEGYDVLVRVHSECLTGDVFGSLRCDCGPQLNAALARVAADGRGVVLYIRGHEGRAIGLTHKLRAYELQEAGHDTVEANLALGLPIDGREYASAAAILRHLGVRQVRLLTNNPRKGHALEEHGITVVERVPLVVPPNPNNIRYLHTKAARMGHVLNLTLEG
jgi:3,4-dihydroxy 2-butanone 4-phosphate synthase/GTP cyclohydrolase II